MDHFAVSRSCCLHDGFAHCGVRVYGFQDLMSGSFQFTRNNGFGNHFGDIGADHVRAQPFAVLFIKNHFDKSFGSTGGASRVFRQPGYQRGKVPKRYSSYFGGHARVVPDVALIADPMSGPGLVQTAFNPTTGADVVVRRSIGGTSVAAPVFAGAVAAMADRNGERLGFLNPSLYRARDRAIRPVGPARKPAVSAQAFYTNHLDASDGFEFVLFSGGQYGTLEVRKGYDDVTGLGSPSARILAKGLRRMSR